MKTKQTAFIAAIVEDLVEACLLARSLASTTLSLEKMRTIDRACTAGEAFIAGVRCREEPIS